MDIGLAGGSYEDDPAVHQSSINLYPSVEEARGRSRMVLKRTPGIEGAVVLLGNNKPCRAFFEINDQAYGVWGDQFYLWGGGGVAIPVAGAIVPGTGFDADEGRLAVAVGDSHIVLVNDNGDVFVYTIFDGSFAQTTDVDIPAVGDVVYLDGYFIYSELASLNTRRFYVSALNDPFSVRALDFATKESDSHSLVALHVSHGDLFLLGRRRTEVWRNIGNNLFPFQRIQGSEMDRGIAARDTAEEIDNTFMFVGDDLIVYRVAGYVPQRVSNHAVERHLATLGSTDRLTMFAQSYSQEGHYFYALTAGNRTFVYDATFSAQVGQQVWSERRSYPGAGPIDAVTPWRAAWIVEVYGQTYIGDSLNGSIGRLTNDETLEYGLPMRWSRTTAPIFADADHTTLSRLEVRLEGGGNIGMEQSKDGGSTWSTRKERDMASRCIWRRLGRGVDRIFRFSGTDPVTLISGHADYEQQA